MVLGAS